MNELSRKYRHKIKTVQELREIIGPRPRSKTVVMCHGVFDLVHPGHIRHLVYAKDKADILIASLTGDNFITKSPYRPFVPQELRALNLAALEMVDYGLVDENAARSTISACCSPTSSPRATNIRMAARCIRTRSGSMPLSPAMAAS
jgi:cytidyltransferase-like protein